MPTYDYACPACGGFEALRPLAERDAPLPCPDCGHNSVRAFVSAPRLACVNAHTRTAMDRNERARHAPMTSSEDGTPARLRHPAGCGCCGNHRRTVRQGATVTGAGGQKMFPSKRPWMISH